SEVAEAVSFPKDKIYYHIKKLLALDILFIAETEIVKGIEQNKYLPIAQKIQCLKTQTMLVIHGKNRINSRNYFQPR
ncbi:MAG: hypothetical protein VX586_06680, partial [Candidatus Neomarinimicrobiota bacterium]|nr:hypothetical protein [Candidatus Neomarinimicrobiota bacterium]